MGLHPLTLKLKIQMKTYNERLQDLATEMAKSECARVGVNIGDTSMVDVIKNFKPLAAIALKHMAEAYKQAINEGNEYQQYGITQHLTKTGLIEPQTT